VRLAGERALVTGSTSGIGRAVAERFAREGAAVVVTGRDPDRGAAVVDGIRAVGGTARLVLADLAREEECTRLVDEAVAALGGLSILVNNAVAAVVDERDAAVGELSTAAWEATLRVNLSAPMWLCRAAIPYLVAAGRASIVNVSSRQAERAARGFTAYIASKSGLNGLTRAIAVDYAAQGVRCNTISPGYVLNERRDAQMDPERRARLEGMHLTRLGVADDVAHAAVFLASRESELLTGINLPLDGGSSAARGLVLG
jgi:NAD(P)-dependent dehydrogenase (short-subunit alcohol dehydrogenase family)